MDNSEDSAWFDSGDLEVDRFTWNLTTVSVGVTESYIQESASTLNTTHSPAESSQCNGAGHFGIILKHSKIEFGF